MRGGARSVSIEHRRMLFQIATSEMTMAEIVKAHGISNYKRVQETRVLLNDSPTPDLVAALKRGDFSSYTISKLIKITGKDRGALLRALLPVAASGRSPSGRLPRGTIFKGQRVPYTSPTAPVQEIITSLLKEVEGMVATAYQIFLSAGSASRSDLVVVERITSKMVHMRAKMRKLGGHDVKAGADDNKLSEPNGMASAGRPTDRPEDPGDIQRGQGQGDC